MSVILSAIFMFFLSRFVVRYLAATPAPERVARSALDLQSGRRPNIEPWLPAWCHRPLSEEQQQFWRQFGSAQSVRSRLLLVRDLQWNVSYWSLVPWGCALATVFMLILTSASHANAVPTPAALPELGQWRFALLLVLLPFAIVLGVSREWLNSTISYWVIDRAPTKLLDSRTASIASFVASTAALVWWWKAEASLVLMGVFFAFVFSIQTRFWQFWVHLVAAATFLVLVFVALMLASVWPLVNDAARLWPLLLVVLCMGFGPAIGGIAASLWLGLLGEIGLGERGGSGFLAAVIPFATGWLLLFVQRGFRTAENHFGPSLVRPSKSSFWLAGSAVLQCLVMAGLTWAAALFWLNVVGQTWPQALNRNQVAGLAFVLTIILSPLLRLLFEGLLTQLLASNVERYESAIAAQRFGEVRRRWLGAQFGCGLIATILCFLLICAGLGQFPEFGQALLSAVSAV